MSNLFLNLFRARDRVGNFLPQQFPVTLPHPLHGGLDGRLRQAEDLAQLRVRLSARLARLVILKQLEQLRLAARRILLAQAVKRRLQDRLRPPALEDLVRRQFIHGFKEITVLPGHGIERNNHLPAATLLAPGFAALLTKEVLEEREQERPELALLMVQVIEEILLQQPREKLLRQVLRLRRVVPLAPDLGVERRPVGAAQLLQRFIPAR